MAADVIEAEAFGADSIMRRQEAVVAKVIQKDSDEPYMNTFQNPMKPILTNADEPYMDAYADDQSSAVRDGKSSTGVKLAPLRGGIPMAVDYWSLAKDFKPGDFVQRVDYIRSALSPYVGKVVAVHPGLGVIDVQWPLGCERVFSDDVIRVNPAVSQYLPPGYDSAPNTYDVAKGKQASTDRWGSRLYPPTFFKDLVNLWAKKSSEVVAWDTLYRKYPQVGDALVRQAVSRLYGLSTTFFDLFLKRTAAYWYAENRSYRVTKAEVDRGAPSCPKCGTPMKKTTYKMEQGKRVRLFACPKDLFLLKTDSLHGPDGNPVTWLPLFSLCFRGYYHGFFSAGKCRSS